MQKRIIAIFVILFILLSIAPRAAQATEINYNYLISDGELTDYTSLSQTDIHDFLVRNNSFLRNYFIDTGEGQPISATELIYRAANLYKINPKFLLVLIQKEQSLITDPAPDQRSLDFAAGYGCFDGSACQERWRGFHKQVNSAAAQFRYYIDNIDEYNFQPGKTNKVCNDYDNTCAMVTPQNASTAALFVYTPHLHGNELFKNLWDKYFAQSFFPDGSLLQVKGDPGIYLIENGLKRPFKTKAAFASRYSANNILNVEKSDLDSIDTGTAIEFAANTLLQATSTGDYWLLTDRYKRKIASSKVFRLIGYNPEEAEDLTLDQLNQIPDGPDITISDAYPTGALIQNTATGGVYYVESGIKYPLWSKELIKINFPKMKIYPASQKQLDQYKDGSPITFKDGTLLKSPETPDVYVISNGKKLRIPDEKTFLAFHYKWTNVISTNAKVLTLYPDGAPVTF